MSCVVLNLKMKPEANGGRHAPFSEGYAPHLVASGTSEMLGVRVVECSEWIYPGTESKVKFSLIYFPSVNYESLKVGTHVDVVEGSHVVGHGIVDEVAR